MTKTRVWAFGAMIAACTGGTPPASSGGQTAPAKAEAPADPKASDPGKAAAPTTTAPPATTPGPGEDWLVWWFRDGIWTTRWLRVDGDTASVVGERKGLIVGDGAKIWQIERADTEVDVKMCWCADDNADNCPVIGKVGRLGLRARELNGDGVVTIQEAPTEAEWGEDISYGLAIVGGTQARLTIEGAQEGFFCGAHGLYFTRYWGFDVAAGKDFELSAGDWWKRLPDPMRRAAATEIQKELNECEESNLSIDEIMNNRLNLTGTLLALKGGAPTITWKLSAEVIFICAHEYQLTGKATSGLIPEAAPIGFGGPLPAGVTQALATIGEAESLGFSRLVLLEPARAAQLAAFTAAAEPAWAPQVTKLRLKTSSEAQAKLDEGRKWTREKDYAQAIAAFDAAVGLDAELAAAYSGRGYARMLAGDAAKAKQDFTTALTKNDDAKFQAAVWFNMGSLAEQMHDKVAARAAYEKSQSLRSTKQATDALAALDGGKKE